MIIKRADGASSAQIVTVFNSRALVDILTLPNHFTDIALIITPPLAFGLRHSTVRHEMQWDGIHRRISDSRGTLVSISA